MSEGRSVRWLRVSCYLTLLGLGLMVWSVLDPRPIPVILAMSAGQGIGTLAFAIYVWVVFSEARQKGLFRKQGDRP